MEFTGHVPSDMRNEQMRHIPVYCCSSDGIWRNVSITGAPDLRHEPASHFRLLGSWDRVSLETSSVCVYSVCVVLCVGRGLARGWSPVQWALPTVYRITKLHGLSPPANYTDRATASCRRSDCQFLRIEGCHVVSVTDPYGRILGFLYRSRYFSIE
jgi:hypothetical protein